MVEVDREIASAYKNFEKGGDLNKEMAQGLVEAMRKNVLEVKKHLEDETKDI